MRTIPDSSRCRENSPSTKPGAVQFAARGVTIERVLSDNGSAYRSHAWREACHALGIKPKKTRPYRPQTNGKICEDLALVLHRTGLTPAKV